MACECEAHEGGAGRTARSAQRESVAAGGGLCVCVCVDCVAQQLRRRRAPAGGPQAYPTRRQRTPALLMLCRCSPCAATQQFQSHVKAPVVCVMVWLLLSTAWLLWKRLVRLAKPDCCASTRQMAVSERPRPSPNQANAVCYEACCYVIKVGGVVVRAAGWGAACISLADSAHARDKLTIAWGIAQSPLQHTQLNFLVQPANP